MARLRLDIVKDEEDDLPDLHQDLGIAAKGPLAGVTSQFDSDEDVSSEGSQSRSSWPTSSRIPATTLKPHSPLLQVTANGSRAPITKSAYKTEEKPLLEISVPSKNGQQTRQSPMRSTRKPVNYRLPSSGLTDVESSDDDESFTDLSGFIVSDGESLVEEDVPLPAAPPRTPRRLFRGLNIRSVSSERVTYSSSSVAVKDAEIIDLLSPSPKRHVSDSQDSKASGDEGTYRRASSSYTDLSDGPATLTFSPPRLKSPRKIHLNPPPATPPCSPTKKKLESPSKRYRIPPTPHRPSIDAYWSQEVINSWNDSHSPVKSPRTALRDSVDLTEDSEYEQPIPLSTSKASKSPLKKDLAARKAFDKIKEDLADSFLSEIDKTLTNNQVSSIASSTGGIKILWSKKLNTTAGRANWRREIIRTSSLSPTKYPSKVPSHQHATIELATKVITDSTQLLNVLAHEYCHLCVFMIDGVKDRPHGKEFKTWAVKTTKLFKDRGVEVTTKHSFEIQYKYAWECENEGCGVLYERHSRSIDTAKMGCGRCKGRLRQVRPVPRGSGLDDGKGRKGGKRSEYQEFVKREHERVRRERPGIGFGELMKVLGAEFREKKKESVEVEVKEIEVEVEVQDGVEVQDRVDLAGALKELRI